MKKASNTTKNKIMKAALALGSKEGLAALTMDEVAELSGIRKASIYHYFRHRDDLIRETIRKFVPGKDFSIAIDFKKEEEEILGDMLKAYVSECVKGKGRDIFRILEGSRLYDEVAAEIYAEEADRRLKAVTSFLKLFESKKKVSIQPFDEAAAFYGDFAHVLIVEGLQGGADLDSRIEGFAKAYKKAFVRKKPSSRK